MPVAHQIQKSLKSEEHYSEGSGTALRLGEFQNKVTASGHVNRSELCTDRIIVVQSTSPCEQHTDLCNQSCMSVELASVHSSFRLSVLDIENVNAAHNAQLFDLFFQTCNAYIKL